MGLLVKLHETQSQLPDFCVILDRLHQLFEIRDRVLEADPLNFQRFKEGFFTHPVSEVGQ